MARPPRYLPYPGCIVEITAWTIQGRKLLRPDTDVTKLILGVLGKGIEEVPQVRLIGYNYLSNHPHLYAAPDSQQHLSSFMCFVQNNISREIGTRLRDWPGPFWHRRYDAAPVLDDGQAVRRLRYLLENSVKENLVETVEDWPGANSARAMLTGEPDVGLWIDRTAEYLARRAGVEIDPMELADEVEVPLTPLPQWAHLSQQEYSSRIRELLDDIRDEHAARRARQGITVLGVEKILAVDPYEPSDDLPWRKPRGRKRRKRLACHASTKALRDAYDEILLALVNDYRNASAALRFDGELDVEFPEGTFRPQGAFTEWRDQSASSPLEWIEGLSLD